MRNTDKSISVSEFDLPFSVIGKSKTKLCVCICVCLRVYVSSRTLQAAGKVLLGAQRDIYKYHLVLCHLEG